MAEQSSADYRGTLGRYALFGEIAAGGMATVHLARLLGSVGFARTVAIKRLHPHLAKDPDFVGMFLEEARLAARVRHPNVVATLDVISEDNELFLVMEYIAGESLSRLVRKTREANKRIPPAYVVAIMCSTLEGLHAAHEATSERGAALGIVHRDVSPQNIHVGLDGVARVLDFGIAKATNRVVETRSDQIKGKVAYMSPEQLAKGRIDRREDVYSASVCLWEALTGLRLFRADDVPSLVYSIINDVIAPPSLIVQDLPKRLEEIVMKGLDRDATKRWSSAREMAVELEKVLAPTPGREIGAWVKVTAGDALEWRSELVHRIESETSPSLAPMLIRAIHPAEVESGVIDAPAIGDDEEAADDLRPTLLRPEMESVPDLGSAFEGIKGSEYARRKRRSRLGLIAALSLLGVGGLLLGLRLLQLHYQPPPAATVAVPVESAEPRAIGLAGGTRSAAPAVTKPPAPTTTTPAITPVPQTTPAPTYVRPSAPAAGNDCDNPFTIDAKGGRHPKPHCFRR